MIFLGARILKWPLPNFTLGSNQSFPLIYQDGLLGKEVQYLKLANSCCSLF